MNNISSFTEDLPKLECGIEYSELKYSTDSSFHALDQNVYGLVRWKNEHWMLYLYSESKNGDISFTSLSPSSASS